jgi:hypothetical protein
MGCWPVGETNGSAEKSVEVLRVEVPRWQVAGPPRLPTSKLSSFGVGTGKERSTFSTGSFADGTVTAQYTSE